MSKDILALSAPEAYSFPPKLDVDDLYDLTAQLTNTCLQDNSVVKPDDTVFLFSSLPEDTLSAAQAQAVTSQIAELVGETFKAALGSGSQFQVSLLCICAGACS